MANNSTDLSLKVAGQDPNTKKLLKIAERCISLAEEGNSVALEIISSSEK